MSLFTQLTYLSFAYWCLRAYHTLFLRVYRVFFRQTQSPNLHNYGSWCLVAGCSQGLGRAFLESLAERKFSLILVGPSSDKLSDLASELELAYGVKTLVVDVSGSHQTKTYKKLEEAVKNLEIGIIINNFSANYAHPAYFLEVNDAEVTFDEIIWWNVTLPTQICRIVMPQMVDRGGGVVINVSSTFAVVPSPLLTVFSASKAFVLKFSKDLSIEYGKKGLVVQCLCPGSLASGEERWISPNPKIYVESALRTIGKDSTTTGFFPHTLVIGLIRIIWRLSPDTLIEWMMTIMERNRRREIKNIIKQQIKEN